MGKFGIAERACGVSIILLVDILVSTKMSVEQVYLLPDRGSSEHDGHDQSRGASPKSAKKVTSKKRDSEGKG